ncbi:MAG: methyltransferase domain-containing protein [Nanoarchaeota archaeon]|nr:methyltransferase domain-containing protein [Nanoarchaeota archaeon]MBU1854458.1 methyltransferase domain-containing protein [Nanoarchaeota archaeon]
MTKLLLKKERIIKVEGRKVVLSKFEKHLVDENKDFGTQFGIIKKSDLKKEKIKVGKEEFIIIEPCFLDYYKQIKRLAQIITLKDIGAIITNTGINNNSIILEAGTGSAGLSCFLAKIANKIISYDIHKEHQKVALENIKRLSIKNIELKEGNIFNYKEITEKDIDVFVLDVTEPWKAEKTAKKVLKKGGFLVSYNPNINQVQKFVNSLSENFLYEKTIEIIEREWTVKDKILRPKMKDIGHTGFLTFSRRIK